MRTPVAYPSCGGASVSRAELRHTHKLATINSAGFMSAEDKKLLTTLASCTSASCTVAVSKAENNEIKELTDGLFVKTPSWTDKEW